MMAYAARTSVPIDRSQAEIKKILQRYNADGFVFGESREKAIVQFEIESRRVRFVLPMPEPPGRTQRSQAAFDQACRTRWRALALAIKAKLECVASGITTIEQEFLAHIVLPNGSTVGEEIAQQIAESYSSRKMPPLLGHQGGT